MSAPSAQPSRPADVLVVRTAGARFGFPVQTVRGVLRLGRLTRVPGAQPSLVGLMAVHGSVVAVFDLAVCLGRDPIPWSAGAPAVSLDVAGDPALLVEEVGDVMALVGVLPAASGPSPLVAGPPELPGDRRVGGERVPVIDVHGLVRSLSNGRVR